MKAKFESRFPIFRLKRQPHAGSDPQVLAAGVMSLDGDVIFAVSTATVKPKSPMQVEAIAALVVPEAVERAVRRG